MPRMTGYVGPPVKQKDPNATTTAPPKADAREEQRAATIAQIEAERAPRLAQMAKDLAHLPAADREKALAKVRKGE